MNPPSPPEAEDHAIQIARSNLEQIEWRGYPFGYSIPISCPACGYRKETGHADTCWVKKTLETTGGES